MKKEGDVFCQICPDFKYFTGYLKDRGQHRVLETKPNVLVNGLPIRVYFTMGNTVADF